jgi:hypothetical protein
MLGSDVVERVRRVLQDDDGVRWTDPEVLQWLTDGQRTIVLYRPDACMANESIDLVEGSKQKIPDAGLRLLDVVRNVGGRAVRLVDREVLDTGNPLWHTGKGSSVIRNYAYDDRDPKTFYVSPPAQKPDTSKNPPLVAKLEIMYSKSPPDVTAVGDTLTLPDIYIDPLVNYVLFRCYSKDSQFAQNAALASGYLQACMSMLGVKMKRDVSYSPDLNSKGSMPNTTAIQMEGS